MLVMGRSLFVGLLAWLLGSAAQQVFPAKHLHAERIGDWVSMFLFSPVEIILSALLFIGATALLFGLLHFHISQYLYGRMLQTGWLHGPLCFFSFFVLLIQFVKMPVPTFLAATVALMIGWR
ncbi:MULTISPECIES: hypothetical protein [Brevibacillus]|jgi:hypothetical protein|uniref:hypothetical protein n=1 Tax=Brevibacillus TaxID=55080 RepID=UPI000EC4ECFC|nr:MULTISPECIES: hypothetical protein [Brevibacillus]MDH6349187.1 CHASE2 domain-containing sensor protein [Brevibacillus sp. 1238]MED1724178.1 hypothetical protein [Brevibacillus parabrevis]NRQ52215.1 hypothetical protein [Brevibacillus sp. HD1.4A]UED71422.1 hypothetical protein HP435_12585 [Brevibacillus sp. HD3.3A]WDV97650.1 hypothetical protein PSE45_12030 [Brevibacillus parabrevis]